MRFVRAIKFLFSLHLLHYEKFNWITMKRNVGSGNKFDGFFSYRQGVCRMSSSWCETPWGIRLIRTPFSSPCLTHTLQHTPNPIYEMHDRLFKRWVYFTTLSNRKRTDPPTLFSFRRTHANLFLLIQRRTLTTAAWSTCFRGFLNFLI